MVPAGAHSLFGDPPMKPFLSKLLVAGCVLAVVAAAFAADDNKADKKKKKKNNDPVAALKEKFESSDLPADVKEKALKILEEVGPKLAEARAKVDAALTDEQKKARAAAQKAAREAGKKGKELQDEVNAALKLSEEQRAKLEEAQKAVNEAQANLNRTLSEILNDEQRAKLGIKGGKKKKAA